MFITLHFKTADLNVSSINVIKQKVHYPVGSFKKRVLKCIAEGKYAVIRAIFERTNGEEGIEYHCFDFTGKSFIVIDSNKKGLEGVVLATWINKLEERLEASSTNGPRIYTVKKARTYTTIPDRSELLFHNLMIDKMDAELIGFFKHFKRSY